MRYVLAMTRWGSGSWLLVGFALGCGASPVVEGAEGPREAVSEVVAVAAPLVEVEVAGLRARVIAVAAADSRPKAGVRVELLGPAGEGGLAAEDAAIAATESDAEGGVRLDLAAERTGFVRLRVSAGSVVAVRALDPRDRALAVEIEVHEQDGEVRAIELKAPGSASAALWQAEAIAEGWAAAARGKRAGDPTLVANCEQAAAAVRTAEPALAGRLRVFFVRFAAQRCGLGAQVIAAELAAIGAKEPLWALDYALLMMPLNAMTTSPEGRAAREATLAAVIAEHDDAGLVGSLLLKQVMEGEGGGRAGGGGGAGGRGDAGRSTLRGHAGGGEGGDVRAGSPGGRDHGAGLLGVDERRRVDLAGEPARAALCAGFLGDVVPRLRRGDAGAARGVRGAEWGGSGVQREEGAEGGGWVAEAQDRGGAGGAVRVGCRS